MDFSSLPSASTIDPVADLLAIQTNSLNATQGINRNTFLGLASQPVGLSDTQTLTNKTLTSPTINGATLSGTLSGTYTIGGTPTFPSSVVTLSGSQTLTNKTLTSPTINSPSITNATLSADAITGYTTSGSGTIYGLGIANGGFTGNITVGGTFGVTGLTTLSGGLTVSSGVTQLLPTLKNPYKFSVYRAGAWTDGNGSEVLVVFDTKLYDTGTNFNTSTGLFTAPITGYYQFNWTISKSLTANTAQLSTLKKSGSATEYYVGSQGYQGATTGGAGTTGSAEVYLVAGDTVGVYSYGSGGAGTTGMGQFGGTWFNGFLVSAT